ncbi:MAG TPA: hypothetical protein VK864_00415 [Longimicrobiales bacterium]|nr:hypothetical protein [Longimicrobiales bacterium]
MIRWNREQIDDAIRGRSWAVRLPLLIYFAWVFRNHLNNPFYTSLVGGLNLGIHELGHFLWAPLGEQWSFLGGSLTQCLAPLVAGVLFYRQKDFFAIAIACCWLATNLFNVATYAADALTQQLSLVSPVGGDPIHDWGYLLTRWQKLSKAQEIGAAIRNAAVLAMLVGLGAGGWLLWRMRQLSAPTAEAAQQA